ncbi:MAG: energy-coupling factor transporter transmembrane component T [Candidatus Methanomethylophilaceae archaeon]
MLLSQSESDTWLDGVHPLVKIAAAVMMLLAALLVMDPVAMSLYILALGSLLVLSGCGLALLRTSFIVLPLALLVMASNLWMETDLDRTLVSGLRMMTIAVSITMFAFTTTPAQLVSGLESMRAPRRLTLAIMVMLRFLPVFIRDMDRVRQSNGLRARPRRHRLRVAYRSFMMPVVSRVYNLSDSITLGLHTRGFRLQGERTMINSMAFSRADALLLIVFTMLSTAVVLA